VAGILLDKLTKVYGDGTRAVSELPSSLFGRATYFPDESGSQGPSKSCQAAERADCVRELQRIACGVRNAEMACAQGVSRAERARAIMRATVSVVQKVAGEPDDGRQ